MRFKSDHLPHHSASRQRGMALAIALILLVVVTLVGLAAVRSTTAQQRMTSNFYDRELAFQNAEAALRLGADAIASSGASIRTCTGGVSCLANPFDDPALDEDLFVRDVATTDYDPEANVVGQPQYVIENMGLFNNPATDTGFDQTANSVQYGAQGTVLQATYYRVTARSGDPGDIGERAVVTLQAMYRR